MMQPFTPPPKPNYAAPLLAGLKAPNANAKLIPRLPNGSIDYAALMKIAAPQNQPKPVFNLGGQ
jgi:hypothetical protein